MEKILDFVKKNKKNIIIFGSGFILCLIILGVVFVYNVNRENKKLEKQIKLIEKKEANKKKKEKAKEDDYNIEDVKIIENNTNSDVEEVSSVVDDNYSDNIKSSEADVVRYFNEYDALSSSSNNQTTRDKLKNGVNNIYDFLFKGGTIKGKTFKELSSEAKLKILKITLSIDQKIDYYFPDYKDRIKEGCHNLKERVITKYLETTNKICTNHEDICSAAREDFQNMKKSFSITWSLIKEIAKESTTALKEWYYNI